MERGLSVADVFFFCYAFEIARLFIPMIVKQHFTRELQMKGIFAFSFSPHVVKSKFYHLSSSEFLQKIPQYKTCFFVYSLLKLIYHGQTLNRSIFLEKTPVNIEDDGHTTVEMQRCSRFKGSKEYEIIY